MRPDYSGREKEYYHAFVDGSWFGPRQVGVGGLIYQPHGRTLTSEFSYKLPRDQSFSSSAAEIYAAVEALRRIPGNSLIVIYSDFQEIGRKLKEVQQHLTSDDPTKLKVTGHAYADLFNAMEMHERVQVIHARESSTPLMKVAHSLAQSAALEAAPMPIDEVPSHLIPPSIHKKHTTSRAEERRRDIVDSIISMDHAYEA